MPLHDSHTDSTDAEPIPTVPEGSLRATVAEHHADREGRVRVPIEGGQRLCAGRMALDLDGDREADHSDRARERVGFCIQQLDAADTFAPPIEWSTEVVAGLSIEELVGALVDADRALRGADR